jgi:membrane dipeptidase
VVDHIDHIAKVAGIDHVGLGSDFDGIGTVPQQLEDVSCYPNITQELLNRGYDESAIKKVLGGNILRVLKRAEAVAAGKPHGPPRPSP